MKMWIGGLALLVVFALVGCGGDGGGDDQPPAAPRTGDLEGTQVGVFVDARVEGLDYWTASTASSGQATTNSDGEFEFSPGEMVVFSIGDKVLIYTDAERVTTPLGTVTAEVVSDRTLGHPHEAINILRLLQSVDETPVDNRRIAVPPGLILDDLDFAQDTWDFENDAVTLIGGLGLLPTKNGEPYLIPFSAAAEHFRNSLREERESIDLRGTWVEVSEDGDVTSQITIVIDEDEVYAYGTEPHNRNGFVFTTLFPVVSDDGDDLAHMLAQDGVLAEFGNEEAVKTFLRTQILGDEAEEEGFETRTPCSDDVSVPCLAWNIADSGVLEGNCASAICPLDELRSTINDWDLVCLAGPYSRPSTLGELLAIPSGFCDSPEFTGPVVGYSEVTWADRLGGDRLIRIKRDFSGNLARLMVVDELSESDFTEANFDYSIHDRVNTRDTVVDLIGSWDLTYFFPGSGSGNTVTIQFAEGAPPPSFGSGPLMEVPWDCTGGVRCGWSELNRREAGFSLIHVRGTNVVNWVAKQDGAPAGFYTMRRRD